MGVSVITAASANLRDPHSQRFLETLNLCSADVAVRRQAATDVTFSASLGSQLVLALHYGKSASTLKMHLVCNTFI